MVDAGDRGTRRAAHALSGTARNGERVAERLEDLLELTRVVRRDRRAREAARLAKIATSSSR
jgi:hypothetical protein